MDIICRYRGKTRDLIENKWVEGMPVKDRDRVWMATNLGVLWNDGACLGCDGMVEIDPTTLSLQSPFTDEDGHFIYQNDVCAINIMGVDRTGVIQYENGCFFFSYDKEDVFKREILYKIFSVHHLTVKIVGNVVDNPELWDMVGIW